MAIWFRIIAKKYDSHETALMSRSPGRFHSDPLHEPTSYAAASLWTAWCEIAARLAVPPDPNAFVAYRVKLNEGKWADVTVEVGARDIGIVPEHLRADPAPPECRRLAATLRANGWNGLIFSSVRDRPNGRCIAIFLETLFPSQCQWERVSDEEWDTFVDQNGLEH
ncbi:MAG: RES family NAD+ phosphorylase [Acidobacteriales bacterium]|nr:RES family NAD+ phosphorylase [Terriglobales bacterium]